MQQTHYDALKVSRDAPIEVIRAAYRVLSQKYHPDRHSGDPAAADTMGLLNKAYEVLSDPERRRAHDAWIRQVETGSSPVRTSKVRASRPARVDPEQEAGSDAALMDRIGVHLRQWALYGSALVVLVSVVVVLSVAHEPQMNWSVAATPPPEDREAFVRQAARDVMLRRGDDKQGAAAVPAAPDAAASPSGNSPASATQPVMPVERAEVRPADAAPRLNDTGPAAPLGQEARPSPGPFPSVSPPHEPEFPSVSQPNEETGVRSTSAFESYQGGTEPVTGTQ